MLRSPATPYPAAAAAPAAALEDIPGLRASLLAWYRARRRDLPWRATPDPYRVWISEIMLQQTTVRTVLPYYERFLARFPDVTTLAAAPLDEVLAHWSGLGYYSRARNLHRAAGEVVREHGGVFPEAWEAALALPGIGRYTAAAILSIAHGLPHAVVDGNVIRVLTRLDTAGGNPKSTAMARALQARADVLLDPAAPGDFNQGMMELGATVCTPRGPDCAACPVAAHCRARAEGRAEAYPETAPRAATVAEARALFWIERDGRILMRQRPADAGVMPGLWELPELPLAPEAGGLLSPARELELGLERLLAARVTVGASLGSARHSIMNRRIRLDARVATLSVGEEPGVAWQWLAPAELGRVGMSSIVRKIQRLAGG